MLEDTAREIKTDTNIDLLYKLITFNGNLDIELASKSLSFHQKVIYTEVEMKKLQINVYPNQYPNYIAIGYKPIGKPILDINYEFEKNDFIVGYSPITEEQIEKINIKVNELCQREAVYDEEIIEFYQSATEKDVRKMVEDTYFIMYHMAPGFMYLGDKTFSNFYEFNNLIQALRGKSDRFILDDLKTKDMDKWTFVEKKYIYNLYWLLKSGGPPRGEEFNAFQLTCMNIHEFLDNKISEYMSRLSQKTDQSLSKISEKSIKSSELRKKLTSDFIFIREINGLTVHKKEKLLNANEVTHLTIDNFPKELAEYIAKKFNISISQYKSPFEVFYDAVEKGIKENIPAGEHEKYDFIEELINKIISLAMVSTKADIGMSRSLRNFKEFIEAIESNDIHRACHWNQSDYFCCVVPSDHLINRLREKGPVLANILKMISIRMQYNSWHYMPGHFPFEEVPHSRHFYFPPVMPDVAIWSNQHHKGHINAQVKYSIRSPKYITFHGKNYHAFFDLRLMKQSGDPFSEDDLKTAIFYTSILQSLYQTLLDYISNVKIDYRIRSFTKSWYEKHYTI